MRPGTGGFTLVEVLVALTLLSIIGLISWRGLDHVASQRARADAETLENDRILRTLAQIERDFGQRVPDALFVDHSNMDRILPMAIEVSTNDQGRIRLGVLRRHAGASGVGHVTYAVDSGSLVRGLAAERVGRNADMVPLLDAVTRFDVRFLVNGQWQEPRLLDQLNGRATAIELTIERKDEGSYLQVLPL